MLHAIMGNHIKSQKNVFPTEAKRRSDYEKRYISNCVSD